MVNIIIGILGTSSSIGDRNPHIGASSFRLVGDVDSKFWDLILGAGAFISTTCFRLVVVDRMN